MKFDWYTAEWLAKFYDFPKKTVELVVYQYPIGCGMYLNEIKQETRYGRI